MHPDATDLMSRAERVLSAAKFGSLARSTVEEYRAVADRLVLERASAGSAWAGPLILGGSRNSNSVRRAAWTRRCAVEVARAVDDLHHRRVSVDEAVARLKEWVPEAERTPPLPRGDIVAMRARRLGPPPRPVRSKKAGLRELPADWLRQVWASAVVTEHRHLDALAVLLVTGCRPAEVAWGCAVRRVEAGLEVVIAGAKVTADAGQVWRKITVADDNEGPAAHLLAVADRVPEEAARVGGDVSPGALSMAVTALGETLGFSRRVSAYDIRHQRCADARIAFGGDIVRVAAWLGHAGTATTRHYGRLPSGGCRGARPVGVVVSVTVRHKAHVAAPAILTIPDADSVGKA